MASELSVTPDYDHLASALRSNDFILLYQPIVSADTARTIGLEALVRLKLPNGELMMPDEFIPLAEDTGLILELGEWALRRACTDGLRWPGLRIAVNMSPKQVQHPGFAASVRSILRETGLPPSQLELELTERSRFDDITQAISAMSTLRAMGLRIAIDDFGAGYSGLIYLRRLPVDKIKIDRAFLDSLGDSKDARVLLRSIVRLGRELGKTVTAEGVEETEQQDILAAAGCDELQGYLFSRPLPASDIDLLFGHTMAKKPARVAGAA